MVDDTERYASELFPSGYASWRFCIEFKCGLALTPEFVKARIAVLGDPRHEESQRFRKLYGKTYHDQVLAWFRTRRRRGLIQRVCRLRCGMAGLMLATVICSSASIAHPHHWIDVYTEWQFDATGVIHGVTIRWLFDDYYSILLVDDAAATGESFQTILDKVLSNTAKHRYFIHAEQQGLAAGFGDADQARIGVKDRRIEIAFHLPMISRLDPSRGDIIYRVAEPTYYFEMLHAKGRSGYRAEKRPRSLSISTRSPNPRCSSDCLRRLARHQ